jgi:hypothetical protein
VDQHKKRACAALLINLSILAACTTASDESSSSNDPSTTSGNTSSNASSASGNPTSASGNPTAGGAGQGEGGGANGGAGGSGGSLGVGGMGGMGTPCDKDLGNTTEVKAKQLKEMPISDCDGDGGTVEGAIAGSEVDWHYYIGKGKFGCITNPTVAIEPKESGLRVCQYYSCEGGADITTVECPDGTTVDKTGGGRPGCCGSTGFTFKSVSCKNANKDGRVYIRIDKAKKESMTCESYKLSYHF